MPEKAQNTSARTGELPRLEREDRKRDRERSSPENVPEQKVTPSATTGIIRIITESSDETASREADKPAGE
jgi:hypothetical protein